LKRGAVFGLPLFFLSLRNSPIPPICLGSQNKYTQSKIGGKNHAL
jgi:hypothetical protein